MGSGCVDWLCFDGDCMTKDEWIKQAIEVIEAQQERIYKLEGRYEGGIVLHERTKETIIRGKRFRDGLKKED